MRKKTSAMDAATVKANRKAAENMNLPKLTDKVARGRIEAKPIPLMKESKIPIPPPIKRKVGPPKPKKGR